MKLLGNRLLVKVVPPQEQSAGGIIIPENSLDCSSSLCWPKMFDVLQVGTGSPNRPVEAKPGERVLCHSYTSGPVPLEDGTAIIDESLILAIIPKDNRYET